MKLVIVQLWRSFFFINKPLGFGLFTTKPSLFDKFEFAEEGALSPPCVYGFLFVSVELTVLFLKKAFF